MVFDTNRQCMLAVNTMINAVYRCRVAGGHVWYCNTTPYPKHYLRTSPILFFISILYISNSTSYDVCKSVIMARKKNCSIFSFFFWSFFFNIQFFMDFNLKKTSTGSAEEAVFFFSIWPLATAILLRESQSPRNGVDQLLYFFSSKSHK